MSIINCYPMRKRRSLDKTPGRETSSNGGMVTRTPRRISSSFAEQGVDIIWDNSSPSPRTLTLGKRKKRVNSDDSGSSGGEIADLVKKLADKTGKTPQANSLLTFWLDNDQTVAETQQNDKDAITCNNKTPARPRATRKRKTKNRLKKELEALAGLMQDQENKDAESHSISSSKETSSCTSTRTFNNKPLSIGKTNTTKSMDNLPKHQTTSTCTNSERATEPLLSNTVNNGTSPLLVDEFENLYWEDDEEDILLSQVDISALCETHNKEQIYTNTQVLFDEQEPSQIPNNLPQRDNQENTNICNETTFVTENWDFDDDFGDEDSLLETLDEIERTQTRPKVIPKTLMQNLGQKNQENVHIHVSVRNNNLESLPGKSVCSKEAIERKRLQAQQRLKEKLSQRPMTRQNTCRLKKA